MAIIEITNDGQRVVGGPGAEEDQIFTTAGFAGSATALGAAGNDVITLETDDALTPNTVLRAEGGLGDDTIYTAGGSEVRVGGGEGDDQIEMFGALGALQTQAYVNAGDGDDFVDMLSLDNARFNLGKGHDQLFVDTVDGFGDSSSIVGTTGDGDDSVFFSSIGENDPAASRLNAELVTGNGNDFVAGKLEGAWFRMGAGDDTVRIALDGTQEDGHSVVNLGEGADYIEILGAADEGVLSYGGSGEDTMLGGFGNDTLNGNGDDDFIYGRDGDDKLLGGDGNDWLFGGEGIDYLNGGNGNDELNAGNGNDNMRGGQGDDTLNGGNGDDRMRGNDGNDLFDAGAGDDTVRGDAGDDRFCLKDGDDVAYGGTGNDRMYGDGGDDLLFGEKGDDKMLGGDGDDTLFGGAGRDFLNAGAGNNEVDGGTGNDVIFAQYGVNTLTGGLNDDVFRIRTNGDEPGDLINGQHTITDFNTGDDTLQLRHMPDDQVLELLFGQGDGDDLLIRGAGDSDDNYILVENQDENDAYWDAFV